MGAQIAANAGERLIPVIEAGQPSKSSAKGTMITAPTLKVIAEMASGRIPRSAVRAKTVQAV